MHENHKATYPYPEHGSDEERARWKKDRGTCATCNSSKLTLKNHSAIWHDGDLYCENGHFVRFFDAG